VGLNLVLVGSCYSADIIIFEGKTEDFTEAEYKFHEDDGFYGLSRSYEHKGKYYLLSRWKNLHIFNGKKWLVIEQFIEPL